MIVTQAIYFFINNIWQIYLYNNKKIIFSNQTLIKNIKEWKNNRLELNPFKYQYMEELYKDYLYYHKKLGYFYLPAKQKSFATVIKKELIKSTCEKKVKFTY